MRAGICASYQEVSVDYTLLGSLQECSTTSLQIAENRSLSTDCTDKFRARRDGRALNLSVHTTLQNAQRLVVSGPQWAFYMISIFMYYLYYVDIFFIIVTTCSTCGRRIILFRRVDAVLATHASKIFYFFGALLYSRHQSLVLSAKPQRPKLSTKLWWREYPGLHRRAEKVKNFGGVSSQDRIDAPKKYNSTSTRSTTSY